MGFERDELLAWANPDHFGKDKVTMTFEERLKKKDQKILALIDYIGILLEEIKFLRGEEN